MKFPFFTLTFSTDMAFILQNKDQLPRTRIPNTIQESEQWSPVGVGICGPQGPRYNSFTMTPFMIQVSSPTSDKEGILMRLSAGFLSIPLMLIKWNNRSVSYSITDHCCGRETDILDK